MEYLKKNVHPLDLAFRLAEDHGIVLLNGGGFDAPDWSLRVSRNWTTMRMRKSGVEFGRSHADIAMRTMHRSGHKTRRRRRSRQM